MNPNDRHLLLLVAKVVARLGRHMIEEKDVGVQEGPGIARGTEIGEDMALVQALEFVIDKSEVADRTLRGRAVEHYLGRKWKT